MIGIIGGGLTGLTLGNLIDDCEIIEKDSECGGLCRSIDEDGFCFDYAGSHVIFSKDKEILEFILKKLGNNVVKRRRNTKIYYKGNYVKYPFENGLSDLNLRDRFDCVSGLIKSCISRNNHPTNFKEWIYATFGKGIAEKYLIPYNEKIWKYDLERIDISWIDGRVPRPPIIDILKSSLGIDTEGYKHQLNFFYPKKGGINALIRSLERDCNSKIINNFEVKSITKENGYWVVSDGEDRRKYDEIIATAPLFHIVHSMKNTPQYVLDALSDLKYNSLITVMLGMDTEKLSDYSWVYIPDRDCLPHRVAFPSNYSKFVCPPGKSSVIAEITCKTGDYIYRMSDDELMRRTIEDLHKKNIINKNDICFSRLKRTEFAYIIYDLNYEKNISIVRNFLEKAGIHLLGRFAEFKYLNMDACIRNAFNFVKKMRNE
ncbi:MAG TPA: FAD-dependent oxidoreductase [Archaeoglobaceae archaeon]|nr:FAD-dependent oxidoreductase [Archaeoglobaceae archaeon]